jgi:hypothetical protein
MHLQSGSNAATPEENLNAVNRVLRPKSIKSTDCVNVHVGIHYLPAIMCITLSILPWLPDP